MAAGRWYRDGSVSVTNGNDYVFGAGTAWATQAEIGDGFSVTENGVSKERYEVIEVLDNYTLKLNTPYQGPTATEAAYALERNWTGRWSLQTKTVADTAELNREMRRLLETQLKGDKGEPGEDANRVLNGDGPPPINLGFNDDYYFDDLTWDVYHKVDGVWELIGNIKGATGDPGLRGTQIFEGHGVPATSLGADGDYYLDLDTGNMYRKVAQTGWHVSMNLRGPKGDPGPKGDSIKGDTGAPGEPGSKWHLSTTEPPDANIGRNDDMCMISTGTGRGRFYQKSGGVWVYQGTVQGQIGNTGAPGPAGVNHRGAWSASVDYAIRDAVFYLGSTWYALKESRGVTPADGEFWTLLAAKGESGDGTGDMLTSVYDPEQTGTVNTAREAAYALAAETAGLAAEAESIGANKVDHNTTINLQGGKGATEEDPAEFYHSTAAQNAAMAANPSLSGQNAVASMNDLKHTHLEQYDMLITGEVAQTATETALADSGDLAYWLKENGTVIALYSQAASGTGEADATIQLAINGVAVGNGISLQSASLLSETFTGLAITQGAKLELIRGGTAGGDFGNVRVSVVVEV